MSNIVATLSRLIAKVEVEMDRRIELELKQAKDEARKAKEARIRLIKEMCAGKKSLREGMRTIQREMEENDVDQDMLLKELSRSVSGKDLEFWYWAAQRT